MDPDLHQMTELWDTGTMYLHISRGGRHVYLMDSHENRQIIISTLASVADDAIYMQTLIVS